VDKLISNQIRIHKSAVRNEILPERSQEPRVGVPPRYPRLKNKQGLIRKKKKDFLVTTPVQVCGSVRKCFSISTPAAVSIKEKKSGVTAN
jgi:hypothetical protein